MDAAFRNLILGEEIRPIHRRGRAPPCLPAKGVSYDSSLVQNVAMEVNHAETAFAHRLPGGGEADWALRWSRASSPCAAAASGPALTYWQQNAADALHW